MNAPARRRVAVVLFNLGGPDGPGSVRPFLFNLFRDRAIIDAPGPLRYAIAALISGLRAKSARANYGRMAGGASPLLPQTQAQAEALEQALRRTRPDLETRAFIAMRYWKPFGRDAAAAVRAFAPDDVVLLPLYPQFSSTTTASSLTDWRRAYKGPGSVRAVCCYPTAEGLIEAHAERIQEAWIKAGSPQPVRLLFSAHGLPEKTVAGGDPYQAQVEATAAAVAARLGGEWDWRICYQSRVGPLKWLGPSTLEAIEEAVSEGLGVVISPIAFVSEHIETLVELDHDYAAFADTLGVSAYVRAPTLGVDGAFINGLAQAVQLALNRQTGTEPGSSWRCAGWRLCPAQGLAHGDKAA
jgi:ferrochelatase